MTPRALRRIRRHPGTACPSAGWLRAVSALVLLAAAAPVPAQRPKVERFTVGSGLPSSLILDLEQDVSGRLWILSRGGVTSFDGQVFRTLSGTGGLPAVTIGALAVDAGGRIWAVTRLRAQVFRFEDPTWSALPLPDMRIDSGLNWASSLVVDGLASVVVGTTADGLRIWDGRAWTMVGVEDGLPSSYVTCLVADDSGILVGTGAGLCRLEGRRLDCRLGDDPRLRDRIVDVAPPGPDDAGGRIWILGHDWLGYLEGRRLHVVEEGLELTVYDPATIGSIARDTQGGLYFGSPAQAYFLDPESGEVSTLGLREGLASVGVSALLVDRESNVWVAGLRGLSRISSRRFLSFDREQGLFDREVSAVAEAAPGRYILGHNAGMTILDGGRSEVLPFASADPASPHDIQRVLDMAVDSEGRTWVAAHSLGLLTVEKDGTWSRTSVGKEVLAVEIDPRGTLWLIVDEDIYVREGQGLTPVETGGIPRGKLGFLRWLHAADQRLFVATKKGVLWSDGSTWEVAAGPSDTANDTFTILVDGDTVWVGTIDGLYELRGRELVKVRRGPVIDRPVYLSLRDQGGRLWFGTDDGVFVWDGRELSHLTFRHGLAGRETNRGAGLVDHRGRVWIGTDQGVSIYQEHYDFDPVAAPIVEVTAVEAGGERRPPSEEIRLSPRQNTLAFHVGTIFLSREHEVVWRYRLEGFDDGWLGPVPISPSAIRYTNVHPGRYRFRIMAGWSGGAWGDEVATEEIFVAPPLWRRPWFYVLAAAAIVLAALGIHRFLVRTIRARARELEALNARLEATLAERQQLIGELEVKNAELERFTYTVSHDLKSPLVTITGFLGFLLRDAKAGNLARLERDVARIRNAARSMSRLLNELLELSRVGRMVNPCEDLSLTDLAREAEAQTSGILDEFGVRVDVAAGLPVVSGDRVRLLEVFQNLIENAVKFRGEEPHPHIEIGGHCAGGEAVCYVRDNGMGIEPRYHEKIFGLFERLDQTIDGTGVGLALVKRIVELHGGRIWVESGGEGRGTTFFFTLPRCQSGSAAPADPVRSPEARGTLDSHSLRN